MRFDYMIGRNSLIANRIWCSVYFQWWPNGAQCSGINETDVKKSKFIAMRKKNIFPYPVFVDLVQHVRVKGIK